MYIVYNYKVIKIDGYYDEVYLWRGGEILDILQ